MFAMCYDCVKMNVYVGRYLFRDEVCSCLKKWLCTSSANAIVYVNGYNHMWLNHTIGNTGICISLGALNGRLEDSITKYC